MNKHGKSLAGILGAGVLLGSLLFAGAPAVAATANGTIGCTGVRSPALTINSSTSGDGRWVNLNTNATSFFSFPGGNSTRYTGFQRASWNVQNGSGFWYSAPSATCL